MKMPDNISPEIAAYIKALQTENSKLPWVFVPREFLFSILRRRIEGIRGF